MKLTSISLGLLLGAACAASAAETAVSPTSSTNVAAPARRSQTPPVLSPEIQGDHRVTFRLRAPKASEVVVNGQWANGRAALTKDTNGVWSVTVGPVEPGVHGYSFTADGLTMIDPGNPAIKPMREPRTSILHLPGQPPRLHDFQGFHRLAQGEESPSRVAPDRWHPQLAGLANLPRGVRSEVVSMTRRQLSGRGGKRWKGSGSSG